MDVFMGTLGVVVIVCLVGNLLVTMQARDRLEKIAGLLEKKP